VTDFLNRPQVADWLGVTVQQFARLRPELEAKGFPAPTFGSRQGERWDPEALTAWRRSQIPAELRAIESEPEPDAVAAELDRRAADMARGARH
jgi:hypothetical protein